MAFGVGWLAFPVVRDAVAWATLAAGNSAALVIVVLLLRFIEDEDGRIHHVRVDARGDGLSLKHVPNLRGSSGVRIFSHEDSTLGKPSPAVQATIRGPFE